MLSHFKTVFTSSSSSSSTEPKLAPKGKKVTGNHKDLIPYVKNDISITKSQLKKYSTKKQLITKVLQPMDNYYNFEKQKLEQKYSYNNLNEFYGELFNLYRKQLDECSELLELIILIHYINIVWRIVNHQMLQEVIQYFQEILYQPQLPLLKTAHHLKKKFQIIY